MIVRHTRLTDETQARLWPDWRYHCFATNRAVPTLVADLDHRDHAEIELVIRDLKDQALAHFPSGQMHANSAWTVIAAIAHNLARWITSSAFRTGGCRPPEPAAASCCRSPDASCGPHGGGRCGSPPAGPGKRTSSPFSTCSARCPPEPDPDRWTPQPRRTPASSARSPLPANRRPAVATASSGPTTTTPTRPASPLTTQPNRHIPTAHLTVTPSVDSG